jgi:hypothetical protein
LALAFAFESEGNSVVACGRTINQRCVQHWSL